MESPPEHFQGKPVAEHLKEARLRGAIAAAESHGTEMSGHRASCADAAKETAVLLLLSYLLLSQIDVAPHTQLKILLVLSSGWLIWKTARSALIGWSRLERLHRLIEEERWEIEHHRQQEKEELTEIYRAKGLTGTVLEEVIEVLMADDNRLLQVMLEEELGVTLESYEHPLKQSCGAALGVLLATAITIGSFYLFSSPGVVVGAVLITVLSSGLAAKLEKNIAFSAAIWSAASLLLAAGMIYFLTQIITL